MVHTILLIAALLAVGQPARQSHPDVPSPARVLAPTWTRSVDSDLGGWTLDASSITLASSGRCIAVAGEHGVAVIDLAGQDLWRWEYRTTNRYITAGPVAVSPDCDTIALAGNPGYRYTWIATRQGRRTPLRTSSTPLSVAFDRDGQVLAVGTGGPSVLLYDVRGDLQWKRSLSGWCCTVDQLAFAPDNASIAIGFWGAGMLRKDGTVAWTYGASAMVASRDFHTFAVWAQPNHGPGIGFVGLIDEQGNPLWRRLSSATDVAITASGERVAARINDDQNPARDESVAAVDLPTSLQVLRRDGSVETTLPSKDGVPIGLSPNGEIVLLRTRLGVEAMDLQGRRLFEVPFDHNDWPRIVVADDFSGFAMLSSAKGGTLRWYRLGL